MAASTGMSNGEPATAAGAPAACSSCGMLASYARMCYEGASEANTWKNPVASGATVAAFNIGFFVYLLLSESLLSLACWGASGLIMFGFILTRLQGSHGSSNSISRDIVNKDQVREYAEQITSKINFYSSKARALVMWECPKSSIITSVAFATVGCLLCYVSFSHLVYMGVNGWLMKKHIVVGYDRFIKVYTGPYIQKAQLLLNEMLANLPLNSLLKPNNKKVL